MARRREATIAPATGPYCHMQDLLGLRAVTRQSIARTSSPGT